MQGPRGVGTHACGDVVGMVVTKTWGSEKACAWTDRWGDISQNSWRRKCTTRRAEKKEPWACLSLKVTEVGIRGRLRHTRNKGCPTWQVSQGSQGMLGPGFIFPNSLECLAQDILRPRCFITCIWFRVSKRDTRD